MDTDKKKFILAALLLVINIIGIISWWVVYSKIRENRGKILDLRKDIYIAERRADNIRRLNSALKDVEKDRQKILAVFLSFGNVVNFIEELENLSRKSGVSLKLKSAILPDQKGNGDPSFQLSAFGQFRDLMRYLDLVGDLPYGITFNQLNFSIQQISQPKEESKKSGKNSQENIFIKQWQADFDIRLLNYKK